MALHMWFLTYQKYADQFEWFDFGLVSKKKTNYL